MTDLTAAVQAYMGERAALGVRRYGQPLRSHNGRDALRDAFEEAVDCLMYLTQERLEENDRVWLPQQLGPLNVLPIARGIVPAGDGATPLGMATGLVLAIAAKLIERDGRLPAGDSDPQPAPSVEQFDERPDVVS